MVGRRDGDEVAAASGPALSLIRAGAIGAAGVSAAFSQGHVVVLALLLGLAAGRVSSGAAAAGAAAAVLLRWGSPSLGALAGGQSVLGGAGLTGTSAAAASAWLAATALVLATTPVGDARPSKGRLARLGFVAPALPFGLAAAAVVAGPGPGGALGLRVAACAVAVALAAIVAATRTTPGADRVAASLAVLSGVAAAVAAGMS